MEPDEPEAKTSTAKPGLLAGRRKLVALALGAALLLGGAGGGYFLFAGGGKHGAEAKGETAPVAFVDLPEMLVNLSAPSNRPQYLRLKIALEVADAHVAEEIRPVLPRVVDAFQMHLRELRPDDLTGSAALYRLKEELRRRVDLAIHPARLDAVLFREIVVQ
jgi:flagellar FliL protein